MGKTLEEKKAELEALKKENQRADEEEKIDAELKKERKKKKDRGFLASILREIR